MSRENHKDKFTWENGDIEVVGNYPDLAKKHLAADAPSEPPKDADSAAAAAKPLAETKERVEMNRVVYFVEAGYPYDAAHVQAVFSKKSAANEFAAKQKSLDSSFWIDVTELVMDAESVPTLEKR